MRPEEMTNRLGNSKRRAAPRRPFCLGVAALRWCSPRPRLQRSRTTSIDGKAGPVKGSRTGTLRTSWRGLSRQEFRDLAPKRPLAMLRLFPSLTSLPSPTASTSAHRLPFTFASVYPCGALLRPASDIGRAAFRATPIAFSDGSGCPPPLAIHLPTAPANVRPERPDASCTASSPRRYCLDARHVPCASLG